MCDHHCMHVNVLLCALALSRVDFLPPITKIYLKLYKLIDLHVQYALSAFIHMHSHEDNCTC